MHDATIERMTPGRELDAMVAEVVFGQRVVWTPIQDDEDLEGKTPRFHNEAWEKEMREDPETDAGDIEDWDREKGPCSVDGEGRYDLVPEYSTRFAISWGIVEKLEKDGILLWQLGREDAMPNWRADMGRSWKPGVHVEAATPELAICLAALKAATQVLA